MRRFPFGLKGATEAFQTLFPHTTLLMHLMTGIRCVNLSEMHLRMLSKYKTSRSAEN